MVPGCTPTSRGGREVRTCAGAIALLLLCITAFLNLSGCGSESCGPETCRCEITLDSTWPNDDGRGWEYEYTWRTWDDTCHIYSSIDDVPPAPSLDRIESILDSYPIGPSVTTRVGTYKMRFSGDSTTMSGATAQALRDTAYFPERMFAAAAAAISTRAFLAAHVTGRSAGAGTASLGDAHRLSDLLLTPYPILIHGGAWEKTEEYIGTYGDVHTDLAWKFLTADLCAGSEFSFDIQIPETEGVSAQCRVLGVRSVVTEMGTFTNGLDCMYLVDLGVMTYGGEHGTTGYARHITYGRVVYVPDVGPVYSYERFLVCVADNLSLGAGDMELSLVSTGGDEAM
jgi:hypothetical protein